MIDHVIAFRAELEPDQVAELFAQWDRLREIPEVVELVTGENFGNRSRGFEYCMRITFEDAAGLEAYEKHPVHIEVRTYNRAHTLEHICVDFEWSAR
jgi:hypothetical protein